MRSFWNFNFRERTSFFMSVAALPNFSLWPSFLQRISTNSKTATTMQTLRPSQVPEYLRTSSFYLGLNAADDDEFSIPLNHMKLNTNVDTLVEMTELLNTIRFWGFEIFPHALFDFAALQPKTKLEPILQPFRADLKFISTLCSIVYDSSNQRVCLEKAMGTGNIHAVQHFHKRAQFTTRAITLAAGRNALDCLQYALSDTTTGRYETRDCNDVYVEAVRNGCMDSILYLQQSGFPFYTPNPAGGRCMRLADEAASSGQYDVLKYLHSQDCHIGRAAVCAADAGRFDCLMYAIENGALLRGESYYQDASGSLVQRLDRANHLKPIVLALSNYSFERDKPKSAHWDNFRLSAQLEARPTIDLIVAAAEYGSVACLQHLHQVCVSEVKASGQRLNWLSYAFSISSKCSLQLTTIAQVAARAQQWGCLRFLITHNCSMNKRLTTILVQAGQLELYHLATAHGCEVSVQAACQFARDGNVALLQHALEHGCERAEEILRAAARHGQLQCLKYAHAQGCSWSALVSLDAARGGHLECLQYLQEHGCPAHARVGEFMPKQNI